MGLAVPGPRDRGWRIATNSGSTWVTERCPGQLRSTVKLCERKEGREGDELGWGWGWSEKEGRLKGDGVY